MSTMTLISSKQSLQLRSLTELYDGVFRPGLQDGNHYAYLVVYRFRSVIEKTGTFNFNEKSLKNALYFLNLRFSEIPHGLEFALYVFTGQAQRLVVTTVPINSLMVAHPRSLTKGVILKLAFRQPSTPGKLTQLVNQSVRRWRKKTTNAFPSTSLKPITLRPNPQSVIDQCHTIVITTGGGTTDTITPVERFYRIFNSVRTPDFKKKAATGQLPVNPYTMYRVETDKGYFRHNYQYVHKPTSGHAGTLERSDFLPGRSTLDLPCYHNAPDENLVISRLQGKITGNNTANLAEDLATSMMTLKLLTNSVSRLSAASQLLLNGNLKAYAQLIGQANSKSFLRKEGFARRNAVAGTNLLAELWLEYRYGWLPLLNSISSSMGAFSQYMARNPRIVSVSASAKETTRSTVDIFFNPSSPLPPAKVGSEQRVTTTKLRMGLHYHASSPMVALFSQLGLTNPVALGWELVPFSFVVDWFLTIGQAFNALSAFDGLTFHSGYRTLFTKEELSVTTSWSGGFGDDNYEYTEDMGSSFNGKAVRMDRSPLLGFPSAQLPTVKNPFSFIHTANAVALLVTNLSGKLRH